MFLCLYCLSTLRSSPLNPRLRIRLDSSLRYRLLRLIDQVQVALASSVGRRADRLSATLEVDVGDLQ